MTSTTQSGPSRRSFLAAATAVCLAAAGGAVLTGASSAAAATGADVTWRISSEPDEAKTGYAGMLNGIRNAMRAGRHRPDTTGPAVDVTDIDGTSSFVLIDLHAEDRPEFIRVFMRRSDSYIMGWRAGVEDGAGAPQWGTIFRLDPEVQLPDATLVNTNIRFQDLANYSDLQQQGATRDGMQITPASFNTAVLRLQNGDQVETRLAASAILQIIVGVAEASRFRNQAADTVTAFANGQAYTVTQQAMAQHNNWATMSAALLAVTAVGIGIVLSAPLDIGAGLVFATAYALQRALMTAYHSNLPHTKGKGLLEDDDVAYYVEPEGMGDYPTLQAAVSAAPSDGVQRTVFLAKGTYAEAVVVLASRTNLFIKGEQGTSATDVVLTAERAHGMTNPATGTIYGTEGSAVLTVKAPGVTVAGITIQNTFDPANHPEVDAYSTQAVALAAEGDRQVYTQLRILSRQDTVLVKSPVPTDQNRQYFVGSYIEGSVDFIFGNATAVFDRCNIAMLNWVGGTVLAPNTDYRKDYGILVTGSEIFTNGVPEKTMYLGRPWHNTADAWPQAVVRDTTIHSGVDADQPWTDMTPDYPWSWARFKEYNNIGAGTAVNANTPQLTAAEASDYTAQKYLAGTDGWNPVY
ncbi:pectinesterase family protein [Streptomyces prunicolor]|uniref:pectinesterase family protein n=1 Tax=Streptomyces prunicolor TaxID=67348 RepID=UPI0037D6C3F0